MSGKGALSYEANEPSFLRKLRNQQAGRDTDRHERQIARPKRAKVDVDDDAPTYVDEDGNDVLSREEYEALIAAEGAQNDEKAGKNVNPSLDDENFNPLPDVVVKPQEIVEVGKGVKKRRAAKMVGMDDETEHQHMPQDATKSKKKAKAVKLSFGTNEAE